jgi:DNA transformation protein
MSEFVNFLHEVFESFGPIRSRKMFGGHGIYHQDLMFGLVADDELYLKTDAENIAEFEERELQPFEFKTKDGKVSQMSYLKAPEEIYDDPDQARYWADLGFAAALRNSAKKNRNKKLKKKS